MDNYDKVYVEVVVEFNIDGKMIPKSLKWDDGTIYSIDKILDERRAASLKAGGQGIRYLCRIHGKEKYLFYEKPKWFVEVKR
ncbi:hypothetical protein [Anaerotignum propionicum]|uniref:Uncharacterized protein n=1 Tax=Anaerotignum propionicum DSM 1682 TaxID=991789 RepID=A0A0X1U7U8_ANAPI|nr:hypothetical protein [Anaerotignum propionicum]AMJ41017.1 hypothetical protein CPRO_14240 [Anaerotignum propionicum DSM 1682]SHE61423.1 hypothetical protein SAMN02745151_01235 [[Clostridium] propionicum DSM 1682] [Anaerotignum propionicum DSM 1682]